METALELKAHFKQRLGYLAGRLDSLTASSRLGLSVGDHGSVLITWGGSHFWYNRRAIGTLMTDLILVQQPSQLSARAAILGATRAIETAYPVHHGEVLSDLGGPGCANPGREHHDAPGCCGRGLRALTPTRFRGRTFKLDRQSASVRVRPMTHIEIVLAATTIFSGAAMVWLTLFPTD